MRRIAGWECFTRESAFHGLRRGRNPAERAGRQAPPGSAADRRKRPNEALLYRRRGAFPPGDSTCGGALPLDARGTVD